MKKRKLTPEERAERAVHEVRFAETTHLLEERIAYHRAKLEEEHGPDYTPLTLDEHYERLRRNARERRAPRDG